MSTVFHYFHPDDNVAPNATVTTSGTEDTSYPLTNLTDLSYAKIAAPAKLTGATGAFVLDFGSAQTVAAIALWHNFDAGLAVSFQGHTANSWATPSFSTALTIPPKRADHSTVKVYRDISALTTTAYRYWRVSVTGTNSAALGLKVLLFSRIRQLERNMRWGYTWTEQRAGIEQTTDALVPWAYDLGAGPRRLDLDLIPTDADILALRAWFRAAAGSANPVLMVPDPTAPEAWLVRFASGAPATLANVHTFRNYHQVKLAFTEITAGDPEWT